MKTIGVMLELIDGLRCPKEVSEWERQFIQSCMNTYFPSKDSTRLSSKRVEIIERIYKQHFG